ncbi:5-methylcytosine rRNA methyltransferase NSUN4 [Halotydeus destructor]|nr:5-methylcytosine rRNA methyltransferase NSUN4 [Halotydeus destructor]
MQTALKENMLDGAFSAHVSGYCVFEFAAIMNFCKIKNFTPLAYSLRNKTTNHWAQLKKQAFPTDLALQHYDNFYAKVYGEHWKSARIGLLSPNKYCAIVNIFADNEQTEDDLRMLGAVELNPYYQRHWKKSERYKQRVQLLKEKRAKKLAGLSSQAEAEGKEFNPDEVEVSDVSDSEIKKVTGVSSGSEAEDFVEMFQTDIEERTPFVNAAGVNINLNDFVPATELRYNEQVVSDTSYYSFYQAEVEVPVEFVQEHKIDFPDILKVFTFPRGSLLQFPSPKPSKGLDVLNYFLMDGASILPVLALGIQPKDVVGDFCAAPGGKSLAMLLTLRPSQLICNEKSLSRLSRLRNVMNSYVPKLKNLKGIMNVMNEDAESLSMPEYFDKILLDVPCTNDRHSVQVNDNNVFKNSRIKERLGLPHQQSAMLVNAIKCLKPGGSLVYSTCSMSPIQNDGVVHMALKEIYDSTKITCSVSNMKEAFRPLRGLYRLHRSFKYGQQVVPFLPCNFGPMYISKINRTT